MDDANAALIKDLRAIVGDKNVADDERDTERYRKGWRSGGGEALGDRFRRPVELFEYEWGAAELGPPSSVQGHGRPDGRVVGGQPIFGRVVRAVWPPG